MLYLRQRLVQIAGVQMTQLFESEKKRSLEEAEALYKVGLGLFQSGDMKGAEECFVSAVRPFLSKNTMQNIYVKVEDFAPELLNSMYHMGLIYLQDNETTYSDSYSKAAAIFQYCHKFQEKYSPAAEEEVGDVDYLKAAYLTEKKFLSSIEIRSDTDESEDVSSEGAYYRSKIAEYEGHKEELEGLRGITEALLLSISGFTMESVGERAKSVEGIYKETTEFFVSPENDGLVQRLLADCQEKLGAAPCEFSVIGLGSLAAGKMTPWSDLEFAIITENDNYKNSTNPDPVKQHQEKEYFRNLTKLLHIKVINFGESTLRSVGIESFNNFKTGEEKDEWFWDECINSGFSFDGPHPHACKTPLGRQGGYKAEKTVKDEVTGREEEITETKPDFELIMTPEELASFQLEGDTTRLINHRGETIITREELLLGESEVEAEPYMVDGYLTAMEEQKDGWFRSDSHLVQGLRSTSLIGGTAKAQDLLDKYRERVREQDEQIAQEGSGRELIQKRSLELLAENVDDFQLKLGDKEEGKLLDIKKSIYRIADRVITELANYYGIMPKQGEAALTSWQIIDRMESSDNPTWTPLLSTEGAQHLREALSIAAELRLATYSHNNGQLEGISTYVPAVEHLTEERKKELIEETFHLENTDLLHHFYQIMIRVQKVAKALCETPIIWGRSLSEARVQEEALDASMTFQTDSLFDDTDHTKGLIHARFLEYDKAVGYLERAKQHNEEDLEVSTLLLSLYYKIGAVEKEATLAEKILEIVRANHDDPNHPDIASGYNNLGFAYREKREWDKAIEFYNKALRIALICYSNTNDYLSIIVYCNNLGNVYIDKQEYDKALETFHEGLETLPKSYASNPNHLNVGCIYNGFGAAYSYKEDYDKAIEYYEKALDISLAYFTINPNHPDIAASYHNLGFVYREKGEWDKAIEYYEKALDISLAYFTAYPSHLNILQCYQGLVVTYYRKREYDKVIECYNEALDALLKCHTSNPDHPDIVGIYNGLGQAYLDRGEYIKAIGYYNKALDIGLKCYASNPDHPDIASIYNSLGQAYGNRGEYINANEYYIKALDILLRYHASNSDHPDIATTYKHLGDVYHAKGESDRAVGYYNKALDIGLKCYASNPDHPDIASIYNSLGGVYHSKGESDRAIKYYNKALHILQHESFKLNSNDLGIGVIYNNLGVEYGIKGEYDKAIYYINKALEMQLVCYESTPNCERIAYSYNNLGEAYMHKSEYGIAIEYLNKALSIFLEASVSPNHPDLIHCYNNLALIYKRLANDEKAIECLQEIYARHKAVHGEHHPSVIEASMSLQEAYLTRESRPRIAENIYQVEAITSSLKYKVEYVFKGSVEHWRLKTKKDPSLVDLPTNMSIEKDLTQNLTFVIPEGYGFSGLRITGKQIHTWCAYQFIQKITIGKLGDKGYIEVSRGEGENSIVQKGVILGESGPKKFGGDVPIGEAISFYNTKHPDAKIEFGMVRNLAAQQFIEEVRQQPATACPDRSEYEAICDMQLSGEDIVTFSEAA